MDNETYWKTRYHTETLIQDKIYREAAEYYQTTWDTTQQNINDAINRYYAQVAASANPYSEMRTILNNTETKNLKKRITTTLDTTLPTPQTWLKTITGKNKYTRLQALTAENTSHLLNAGTKTQTKLTDILTQVFNLADIFNKHTADAMGVKFHEASTAQKNALKQQAWLGENYSTRVWDNVEKLAKDLEYDLPHLFVMGLPQQDLADRLTRLHNVGYSQAMRLIVTEGRKINTDADSLLYDQLGVKQYRYLATMDSRTSTICRSLNGEKFAQKDMEVGVNAPPMHPNCRSTTIPVVDMSGVSSQDIYQAEMDAVKTYGPYKQPNGKTRTLDAIRKDLAAL